MREKRKKKKVGPATALGFDPADWEIDVQVGKSFLYNPTNARSYVGVRVTHLPTGRVKEIGRKGSFTKSEADKVASELVSEAMASLRQK